MNEKRNKKRDLIFNGFMLLVVISMFAVFVTFLPETLFLEDSTNSNPIEIRTEWNKLSAHPNRLPTYILFLKISETRDKVENMISYDDFKRKVDNNEIIRVEYVVEYNRVVLYGDEEISPTNIKFWKTIATPQQKFNGSVSFSEPTISENNIIFKEFSRENAWIKAINIIITVFLLAGIVFLSYNIKIIADDKDYENENTNESNEETRS